jgi:heme exporter protein C
MLAAFGWNVLAWLAWGLLILGLRYAVERQHQKYAAQEAQDALNEVA